VAPNCRQLPVINQVQRRIIRSRALCPEGLWLTLANQTICADHHRQVFIRHWKRWLAGV